jgi:DNA-binding XRE family transcriptional regulator
MERLHLIPPEAIHANQTDLKLWREDLHLTQAALARTLAVSHSTVTRAEKHGRFTAAYVRALWLLWRAAKQQQEIATLERVLGARCARGPDPLFNPPSSSQ